MLEVHMKRSGGKETNFDVWTNVSCCHLFKLLEISNAIVSFCCNIFSEPSSG